MGTVLQGNATELGELPGIAAGDDDVGGGIQLLTDRVDQPIDSPSQPAQHAGRDGITGVGPDGGRRGRKVKPREQGGVFGKRSGTEPDARQDGSTDEGSLAIDRIDGDGGAGVHNDAGGAKLVPGGDGIGQPVGPDLHRLVAAGRNGFGGILRETQRADADASFDPVADGSFGGWVDRGNHRRLNPGEIKRGFKGRCLRQGKRPGTLRFGNASILREPEEVPQPDARVPDVDGQQSTQSGYPTGGLIDHGHLALVLDQIVVQLFHVGIAQPDAAF
jgi:hypothetical protein